MRVRQGWSGEFTPNQWGKLDIDVDEDDLYRMLIENGLPEDVTLTNSEVFALLNSEARRLLATALLDRFGGTAAEDQITNLVAEVKTNIDRRQHFLDAARSKA